MAAGFRMRYLGREILRVICILHGSALPIECQGHHRPPLPQKQPTPGSLSLGHPLPLPEVPIKNAVGEALPADADTLQHAIASQLVHDQGVVHHPWGSGGGGGQSLGE